MTADPLRIEPKDSYMGCTLQPEVPVAREPVGITAPLRVDGVDLSHWQSGSLDFVVAKNAGVTFVYHKATDGLTFKDQMHDVRKGQVTTVGLKFGSYHFGRPSVTNGTAEARHFLSVAVSGKGFLVPVLDLENNDNHLSQAQLTEYVHEFCVIVDDATGQIHGIKGLIYTPFNLNSAPAGWKLWRARYSNDNALPVVTQPFKTITIRQFSNGNFGVPNQVAGIGHVDLDHINSDTPATTLARATIGYRRVKPKFLVTAVKEVTKKVSRDGVKGTVKVVRRMSLTVTGKGRLASVVKHLRNRGFKVKSEKK